MTTAINATTVYTPQGASKAARMLRVFERLIVFFIAASLPLENELPTVFSRSVPAAVLLAVGIYTTLFHWPRLIRTIRHPFFVMAFCFIALAILLEYTHEDPQITFAYRTMQMFIGALLLSTLCRDKDALNYALAGVLLAGSLLALAIVFGAYGKIASAQVANFQEASRLRREVFVGSALDMGLNRMSFLCGEAAVVGMALMLQSKKGMFRILMAGFTTVCLLGTFLLFSRGGAMITAFGGIVVFLLYRGKNTRRIILVAMVAVALIILVPDSVFQRMKFVPQTYESGRMEGRTQLYTSALSALPEYGLVGIGAGPYWDSWAVDHDIENDGDPIPVHNTPLQIWIYWGIPALVAFMLVLVFVARSLPWEHRGDPRALSLFGVAACEAVRLLVSHTFYEKSLTITFGLIIGSSIWVWTKHSARPPAPLRPEATPATATA
jgi:O-antigen ligase